MSRNIILVFIVVSLNAAIFLPAGQSQASGIRRLIKSSPSHTDTAKLNTIIRAGYFLFEDKENKLSKVGTYIDSAVSICEKSNIKCPPALHLLRAKYLFDAGDFSISEEEAKIAIEEAVNNKEYMVQAKAMLFIAGYYQRTGFYQQSMDFYERSIALAESHNLKGVISKSYEGQAGIMRTVNDMPGYKRNLERMINSAKAENDSVSMTSGLLWLGTLLTDRIRDFRLADATLNRCLDISLIRKDTFHIAFSSANIGWNYYSEKMYDSALYFYRNSLKYSLAGGHHGISANSLGNLGTIYRDMGNYDMAISNYNKSLNYAKLVGDWYSLSWVYNDMSQLFLLRNDTSGAFNSFVRYKQFNDSLLIKNNTQGMTEARIRYEADAHNKELALLSLRLKNNRILNIGYTVLFFLVVTIGILIIRASKLEAKRRISEMNRKISEITQANLRQQMNPHFIFNTLNSIQYYMYQHDKLATNNYLTKFSSLMRKVLENSRHTSIPLRDELDALNLYLELESLRFKDKFSYSINLDEEIDPLLFKVPTMLIQPYVENSICHGLMTREGKGWVKIDMRLAEEQITCTIEDNGIGREAAGERKKVNGGNHNSLGTQIVSSRLDLVNTLYGTSLKTIYTDLKNEKGEPEGTRVVIHIPIMT